MWVSTTRRGAGAAGVVAGLLRGQVAADPGALRARQGRLDEQQVGVAGGVDQLLAGPAVGAEGEPARALESRLTAWVRMKCGTSAKRRGQRADLDRRVAVVLLDRERLLDQLLVAPGADHGAEGLARAGRHDQPRARRVVGPGVAGDRDRLLARGEQQRVGVRDQVDEVVGVHVRDHDRVDVRVVDVLAQLRRTRRRRSRAAASSRPPRPGTRCRPRRRPATPATCRAP